MHVMLVLLDQVKVNLDSSRSWNGQAEFVENTAVAGCRQRCLRTLQGASCLLLGRLRRSSLAALNLDVELPEVEPRHNQRRFACLMRASLIVLTIIVGRRRPLFAFHV